MDVNNFLNALDKLYEERKLKEVEPLFNKSIEQAVAENDLATQFTILNEMMGFFRDTSQYEKSISACNRCLLLMKDMGIEGTVDYATSLQNIANAHRAAGMLDKALEYYRLADEIYKRNIDAGDYRFASLNNNIALVYQELRDFEKAAEHLEAALSIIQNIEGSEIEVATTYSNLAATLLEINRTDEAVGYLEKALAVFEKDKVKNFHYSAALSAMAAAKCKQKKYEEAARLYEEALKEIEINMGRGTAYQITRENLKTVYSKLGRVSGIELAKLFYEEYGIPMIKEKFPDYESRIAVGFVGEGSERFGFDDEYSTDHDFTGILYVGD